MKKDVIIADELAEKPDNFDTIQEYWKTGGNIELSDKQKDINKRWHSAFVLMEKGNLDSEIAKTLMVQYSVTKMTAYRDIKNAKALFGDVVDINMKIERYFALQSCKELIKMAIKKKDLKAWSSAIRNYIEIAGIKGDNIDADLYAKLEQHIVNINLPDHSLQVLEFIAKSGVIDLSQMASQAEVISWEDVEKQ